MDIDPMLAVLVYTAEHGAGESSDSYTPEWSSQNGLDLTCELCGLAFDSTGRTRHYPDALNAQLIVDGRSPFVNKAYPRFIGNDEIWSCVGLALDQADV